MKHAEVIIIGAGPAGIAAAIQLKRYNIEAFVFEKNIIGGLLLNANWVENYPGFPKGITGEKLTTLFKKQLDKHKIKIRYENVINADYSNNKFTITTDKKKYSSDFLICASGTKARTVPDLEIPLSVSQQIFYEIHSLSKIKNKEIAIIGAGDAAFDYALNLSSKNRVIILNRSNKTKCLELLKTRSESIKNIVYQTDTKVLKIDHSNEKLLLNCMSFDDRQIITVDYLVIAVGRESYLDFMGPVITEFQSSLIVNNKLFFIGDVINEIYRQASISIGDGIKAAMNIQRTRTKE